MPDLAKRYRVKSLGVFGSYVRNEQSRRSDLVILVDFDKMEICTQTVGISKEGRVEKQRVAVI